MGVTDLSLVEIAKALNLNTQGDSSLKFNSIITDSRSISNTKNSLFVALKGRINAHLFVEEMYKRGVRIFLVEKNQLNYSEFPEAGFLIGENTLHALQSLAIMHRSFFKLPVIGITGSNGKTIVKEWLYQLLADREVICKSPRSFNSQIGVPLSVLQLNNKDTLAIFEAGISKPNEMPKLEKIIQPSIGVFTGFGAAHDEGFPERTQKLSEKLKLFTHCKKTIVNCLNEESLTDIKNPNCFFISKKENADLQIIKTEQKQEHFIIWGKHQNETKKIIIPFHDQASILNAITCWATLLILNVNQKDIEERMLRLQPIEMRMELKQGIYGSSLINDSYNSDLVSLSLAIDFLNRQKQHQKKIIILSDLEQTGKEKNILYQSVAELINSVNPFAFIGIGTGLKEEQNLFLPNSEFYKTTDEFLSIASKKALLNFKDAAILLKGARSFEFEKIKRLLQQKSHDTRLEINLNNLVHNLHYFRKKINPETKIMAMVKASSYGSGSFEIASVLEFNGVDYLSVAYADEGVELRKAGIKSPIMVMSPETDAFEDVIDFQLEPEIFSFRVLRLLKECIKIKSPEKPIPIHLKLDTGMHRLGFNEADIPALILELKNTPEIEIKSIFSHLVASDDPSYDDFTVHQINLFESLSQKIAQETNSSPLLHLSNSSGVSRFSNAHFNMVRIGIGLYGIGTDPKEQTELLLVSSLKTKISQLRKLKKGETVGYSRNGVLTKDTLVATLPIGYADGFDRKLGNGKGFVWIKDKKCAVIGNVCMDMIMVDASDLAVEEGEDVVVFETDKQIRELALATETIPYEILTSISSRVKRIFIQE